MLETGEAQQLLTQACWEIKTTLTPSGIMAESRWQRRGVKTVPGFFLNAALLSLLYRIQIKKSQIQLNTMLIHLFILYAFLHAGTVWH